jgi:uncharacterized protein
MKIVLIGATGNAGSRILEEALRRDHTVTAVVRDPAKMKPDPKVIAKPGDVLQANSLDGVLDKDTTVIAAYTPQRGIPDYREKVFTGYRNIIQAVQQAKARLILVGGAGSLRTPDGSYVVDSPRFPEEFKKEATTYRDLLEQLKTDAVTNWTLVSPSAFFAPGERTGKFRVGKDQLLTDASGQSAISMEDFAIAVLDEAEKPAHARQQFTVGY